jgi:hypothetical protein
LCASALAPLVGAGEGIKVAGMQGPFGNRLGIIENRRVAPIALR